MRLNVPKNINKIASIMEELGYEDRGLEESKGTLVYTFKNEDGFHVDLRGKKRSRHTSLKIHKDVPSLSYRRMWSKHRAVRNSKEVKKELERLKRAIMNSHGPFSSVAPQEVYPCDDTQSHNNPQSPREVPPQNGPQVVSGEK